MFYHHIEERIIYQFQSRKCWCEPQVSKIIGVQTHWLVNNRQFLLLLSIPCSDAADTLVPCDQDCVPYPHYPLFMHKWNLVPFSPVALENMFEIGEYGYERLWSKFKERPWPLLLKIFMDSFSWPHTLIFIPKSETISMKFNTIVFANIKAQGSKSR